MLPAGPLSATPFGEILSSRQPLNASPSDSTRELVPATAKMATRKSGPITTPVSLTSRNGESASLAEDAVSGRSVGLNSGSASFRISGAAGLISSVGNGAPGEGRWLVMEPNSVRISHAQTTHPTRIKAGKPITCFNTIGMCESKDFIEAVDGGEIPREEYSVVLKVSKILVSLGASVNLTPAATWRNRRALRRAQTSSTTRCSTTGPSFSGGLLPVVEHQKPRREARSKRIH
jgi:hypothetical protein